MITITANIVDGIGWDLESARGLDQGLEVWNRPGPGANPGGLEDSGGWYRKRQSRAIPDSIY